MATRGRPPQRGEGRGRGEPESEGRAPGAPSHDNGNGNGNGNGDDSEAGRGRAPDRGRPGPGEVGRGRPMRGRRPTVFNDERQIFRLEGFDTHGTSGGKVELLSNYFKLQVRPQWVIYQYGLKFEPPIAGRGLRIKLIDEQAPFKQQSHVTDGVILYMLQPMEELAGDPPSREFTVQQRNQPVKVTVRLIRELHMRDPGTLHFLNVRLRADLQRIQLVQLGRNLFNKQQAVPIEQFNLSVWPGYATSVSEYEDGLLLCVDLTAKVVHQQNVFALMRTIWGRFDRSQMDEFRAEVIKKVVGTIVLTSYNNRTYRVEDIDWQQSPSSQFAKEDGTRVSYVDYYQQQHNISITQRDQPLLVAKPKRTGPKPRGQAAAQTEKEGFIYLIPELCQPTGLDEDMRADFNVMREIGNVTRVAPAERCGRTKGLITALYQNAQVVEFYRQWSMRYENELLKVEGRVLPTEKVTQGQQQLDFKPEQADWTQGMGRTAMHNPMECNEWLVMATQQGSQPAQELLGLLQRNFRTLGMQFNAPKRVLLQDDRPQTIVGSLHENLTKTTKLVMIIVSNQREDRYAAIKKQCCINSPVPSQVILQKTLNNQKRISGVALKVAVQLNCKLGGEAWVLDIPLNTPTMVVGVDTYHDATRRGQSVAGLVCSINKSFTRYSSHVSMQVTEMATAIKPMLIEGLRAFQATNNVLPDRIFFYRDGVSDGELEQLRSVEIEKIKEAFAEIGQSYTPKFTFIVVKKRISTRFVALNNGHGPQNPLPGTVIDTKVTRANWFDFFLVSQSVRQGTVSPTHYNVIYDTGLLKPDHVQRLTYDYAFRYLM